MNANRLPGHELPFEGALYVHGYRRNGPGATQCSCGATSPVLRTTAARKRWHRDHKDTIRQEATA